MFIQSAESFENLMLCKEYAKTTVFDYYININEINFKNTILDTNNVNVYEAEWRYERICVKEINTDENISNELFVLSKCIHPKIVQFLGFHRGSKKTSILFEYMHNGNLEEYIGSCPVSEADKLGIMIDLTKALHYLHNRYPEIVLHRDMKPSNILINKHGEAKLSDFGISKLVKKMCSTDFHSHSNEKGTYMWMSPEVLKGEPYNYTADIFSLGLIMYFIWTEIHPYKELNLNTIQLMYQKNNGTLTLGNVTNFYEFNELIQKCVNYNPTERPNTKEILDTLILLKDMI